MKTSIVNNVVQPFDAASTNDIRVGYIDPEDTSGRNNFS